MEIHRILMKIVKFINMNYKKRIAPMKLYLVRHGEVNHNLYGLYNREDEDLNETGIKQA